MGRRAAQGSAPDLPETTHLSLGGSLLSPGWRMGGGPQRDREGARGGDRAGLQAQQKGGKSWLGCLAEGPGGPGTCMSKTGLEEGRAANTL